MTISKQVRQQLDAINKLLESIYDKRVLLSDLLKESGLSDDEIATIKSEHLSEFIPSVIESFVTTEMDKKSRERQHQITIRYYGLLTGKSETLESIGKTYGISRERIRQIRKQYNRYLRTKKQKQLFIDQIYKIAKQYL